MGKKIHLDIKDAYIRIKQLEQQLQKQETKQNKTKRKRLYYQLAHLKKAVLQPTKLLVDPLKQIQRQAEQKERRVQKKLEKKKQAVLVRKKQKRHQKRCLKCGSREHLLGDCTNIAVIEGKPSEVGGEKERGGFCYKCGSTEHSHKQCSEQEYKLALCFYCGTKGHIARECPKNDKGLYRKGGSCFGCGSVRHILKDCPTRLRNHADKFNNKEQF